jgi:hypothetical protein
MGDYRILVLREDGSFFFPPENPGFNTQREAQAYIKESGDQFAHLQMAIVRFADFISVMVQNRPRVELNFKPRG